MEGRVPMTAFATVTDRSGETPSTAEPATAVRFAGTETAASSDGASFAGFPVAQSQESSGEPKGPPPSSTAPAPRRRKKVPFEKGYSQQDWLRLTRDPKEDLTGNRGRPLGRKITLAEVELHNTVEDAWMVLNGKVYNVTRYVKFHPGGVDYLMQGAGKDATRLFHKYHKWVNVDFMMQKCFLGPFDNTPPTVQE